MRTDVFYAEKHGALMVTADARSVKLRFYTVDRELVDTCRLGEAAAAAAD